MQEGARLRRRALRVVLRRRIIFGVGEECDDGNTRNGDGCSSDCKFELGFICDEEIEPLPASVELPVIYRDFYRYDVDDRPEHAHIDFDRTSNGAAPNNGDSDVDRRGICFGIAATELDGEGKPVLAAGAAPGHFCNSNGSRTTPDSPASL